MEVVIPDEGLEEQLWREGLQGRETDELRRRDDKISHVMIWQIDCMISHIWLTDSYVD